MVRKGALNQQGRSRDTLLTFLGVFSAAKLCFKHSNSSNAEAIANLSRCHGYLNLHVFILGVIQ